MRIALTGGSGRIGRAVIELALSQSHSVVSIDRALPAQSHARPDLTFVQADITHYPELEQALRGCDALVPLAAIPSPHRYPDYEVHNNNVVGSYNALSAAARLGIDRVCQASSVNATGAAFSRWPRYDYFPIDERHPTYNEDPYSLSKWICEQQADSFARRYEAMTIASLRFHWVVPERTAAARRNLGLSEMLVKHLWGYTRLDATARVLAFAYGQLQGARGVLYCRSRHDHGDAFARSKTSILSRCTGARRSQWQPRLFQLRESRAPAGLAARRTVGSSQ